MNKFVKKNNLLFKENESFYVLYNVHIFVKWIDVRISDQLTFYSKDSIHG